MKFYVFLNFLKQKHIRYWNIKSCYKRQPQNTSISIIKKSKKMLHAEKKKDGPKIQKKKNKKKKYLQE